MAPCVNQSNKARHSGSAALPSESVADDDEDEEISGGNIVDLGKQERTDFYEQTGMMDDTPGFLPSEDCDGRTRNSGWWLGIFFIFLVRAFEDACVGLLVLSWPSMCCVHR